MSIGASGKFNHTVGLRAAGTVLAINLDPDAPIFQAADVGIVADWRDALPLLVKELGGSARRPRASAYGWAAAANAPLIADAMSSEAPASSMGADAFSARAETT